MAFRGDYETKFFFSVPVHLPKHSPLSSFAQPGRSNFAPQKNIVASSTASENSGFTIPDQSQIKKIVTQAEFYFSDEYLSKDVFFLKNMQKNKMGFVSVKLLTTFKKMKCLTQNWREMIYALQFSNLLELNKEGTKVRRKEPLPDFLQNINLNKTLLTWNVLSCKDFCSFSHLIQERFLDTITKLFGTFGNIASIYIFRPGKNLPPVVKKFTSSYPELLNRWCALVEYENLKSAEKAFERLSHKHFCSPGQSIKVINLSRLKKMNLASQEDNAQIKEILKPFKKWPKLSEYPEDSSSRSSSTEPESNPVSNAFVPWNSFSPPVMSTTKSYNSSGQASKPNSSSISHAPPLQLLKPLSGPLLPTPISAPKPGISGLQKPPISYWSNRVDPENVWSLKGQESSTSFTEPIASSRRLEVHRQLSQCYINQQLSVLQDSPSSRA
ncbi:la-related protein 6-like isoform X2 [Erythrolamprus reginae]|uniref:la-related protein 6-like isoform X2 n=1 Tax=Erythrolamprus reginae TaxID=121349 RepID=UPI00396C7896